MRWCTAEYDFSCNGVDEAIGMEEGERLIYHGIDDVDPSWSIVERADVHGKATGERGVVPVNYLEIDYEEEAAADAEAEASSEPVAGGECAFVDDASVPVVSPEDAPAPAADDPHEDADAASADAEAMKQKKKKKKKKRKKWRMPTLSPEEHAAALAQAVASRRRCSSRKQSLEAATRTLAAAAAAKPIVEGDAEVEGDAGAEEVSGAAPSGPSANAHDARVAALVAERDEAIREAREEVEARAAAVAELRAELRRAEEVHAGEIAAKDAMIAALRSALAEASAASASAVGLEAAPRRRSAAAEAIALKIERARAASAAAAQSDTSPIGAGSGGGAAVGAADFSSATPRSALIKLGVDPATGADVTAPSEVDLEEHGLTEVPPEVFSPFRVGVIQQLDLRGNAIAALSPNFGALRALKVSFLLCTVTFYANRAHSLTRSP